MDYKAKLCNAMGLDPEKATDAEIEAAELAAIEKRKKDEAMAAEAEAMKNRAIAAEAKLAEAEKAALKNRVDAALKEHEQVIQNRQAVEEALTKDFDGTIKVLKGLKFDSLPNRAEGDLPDGKDSNFDAKVRAQREAVESYVNRNPGVSRSNAFEILRVQGHEAFK